MCISWNNKSVLILLMHGSIMKISYTNCRNSFSIPKRKLLCADIPIMLLNSL